MKEVWYVRGADPEGRFPEFFATKMLAEMYARDQFPQEGPDQLYARIFYRNVWEEEDVKAREMDEGRDWHGF